VPVVCTMDQMAGKHDSGNAEFVVVYRRRRVGKTILVNQFFDNIFLFKVTGLAIKDKTARRQDSQSQENVSRQGHRLM